MPMFDTLSSMGKYSPFDGGAGSRLIWGKVISNKDPKMLGRIKVEIKDIMPFSDKNQLPWVYPLMAPGLGQGPLTATFAVPEEESFIVCIFPNDSIYMGYYTGTFHDRLRRPIDFLSEYPERYGTSDSRENKHITNKDPEVDTIEQRYADGGLSVYDSKHGTWSYRDDFGTDINADRKNQRLDLQFGGIRLQVGDGIFRLKSGEIDLQGDIVSLFGELVARIRTETFSVNASTITTMAEKFHDGLSRTYETLDRE